MSDQQPPLAADTLDGVVRHDFTPAACRWGWNLLHYAPAEDRKSARVMAVGRGVENGHIIDIAFPSGRASMRVGEIEYSTNPPDLFECNLYPVPNTAVRGGPPVPSQAGSEIL